jgi:phosphatidylserine/phosphatidylglycerophosphate/cardiolipin synthase-like enzyme
MANVIARAEEEVILATNYWQDGAATKYITNALHELDRRAFRRRSRVVVKIIYDRGSPKSALDKHLSVPEKTYSGKNICLPPKAEIPNIDLQVMNYHCPVVGTFHSKYMVVDRKIAILQSNNIMDNENMEMMIHLEGPIVDSFYDMALISWHKQLDPPLPSHNTPAVAGGIGCFGDSHAGMFDSDGRWKGHYVVPGASTMTAKKAYTYEQTPIRRPGVINGNIEIASTTKTDRADTLTGETTTSSTIHPHSSKVENATQNGSETAALQNGKPTTDINSDEMNGTARPQLPDHETKELLAHGEQAISQSQIHQPAIPQDALPESTNEEPQYDDDIAGEVARVQMEVSPKNGETRMQSVTRLLNHTTNKGFKGDAPECAAEDEMTPYIPHTAHEPIPIAMVNRAPYGAPGDHRSVLQPQNAVWLSALRNARKNVFIQSPTLNAEPLIPAIRDACERGIDVYCYICLGYNDAVSLSVKGCTRCFQADSSPGRAPPTTGRPQRADCP